MKRILILLVALAVGLTAVSVATAGGSRAKINLRKTKAGKILVNGKGFTVYLFAKDKRNQDNCVNFQGCIQVWPPVTTSGKPRAGKGVKSHLLGTITLADGRQQVTYAGHPLYTYIADTHPGETSYIGVFASGGRWDALNASGHKVTKK